MRPACQADSWRQLPNRARLVDMKTSQVRSKADTKVTVRLTAELAERLKARVERERRTLQTVVTLAIEQYLAKEDRR